MSSDLLAEFDSFYKAPSNGQPSPSNPPKNDISFFGSSNGGGQKWQGGNQTQAQWNNTPAKPSGDIWGDMSSFATPTNPPPQTAPQNDIWDSFKTVPVQGKMPAPSQTFNASRPGLAQSRGMNFGSTKSTVERRPTIDLFSNNIIHGTPGTPATKVDQFAPPRLPATKKSSVGEVLFDADEEQDDDEFGDFEDATAPLDPGPQPIDLLFGATTLESKPFNRPSDLLMSPNAVLNPLPYPQAPKSPSFQERNPFAELGLATTPTTATTKDEKRKSESPVTAWPTYEPKPPKPAPFRDSSVPTNELDDDWGDFADLPPETPAAKTPKDTPSVEADSWGWDWADKTVDSAPRSQESAPPRAFKPAPSSVPKAARTPKISTPIPAPTPASVPVTVPVPKKNKPPPTNIPPPSVLLTLFPPLFNLPQSALFQPVADQPFSLRNRVLSDPTTVKFLRAYLLIATVAARIIAGRKLRWKRDSHLSQAMKIGPAGGKSGMKLAGVDKAEATRESREATEVVRVWKEQLGRLRSAVAAANSSNHDILSHMVIPEIGEVMHINTLKGAMTDVKVCLLCGLKREERIVKVDIDELIEDSFGEWWIGYWGHRDCRNFWEEHESKLKHH